MSRLFGKLITFDGEIFPGMENYEEYYAAWKNLKEISFISRRNEIILNSDDVKDEDEMIAGDEDDEDDDDDDNEEEDEGYHAW
jgi:hypothetical protein